MKATEKIGLVEWLQVVRRSRMTYLKLRAEDLSVYDIRPGDRIKVELKEIEKQPREEAEESDESLGAST